MVEIMTIRSFDYFSICFLNWLYRLQTISLANQSFSLSTDIPKIHVGNGHMWKMSILELQEKFNLMAAQKYHIAKGLCNTPITHFHFNILRTFKVFFDIKTSILLTWFSFQKSEHLNLKYI